MKEKKEVKVIKEYVNRITEEMQATLEKGLEDLPDEMREVVSCYTTYKFVLNSIISFKIKYSNMFEAIMKDININIKAIEKKRKEIVAEMEKKTGLKIKIG